MRPRVTGLDWGTFMIRTRGAIAVALATIAGAEAKQSPPQKYMPAPIAPSDLMVRIDAVGVTPAKVNPTSPVVAGTRLILIDQAGTLSVWNGERVEPLLGPREVPAGLKLTGVGTERVLNVAADSAGTTLYAVFVAANPPNDIPRRPSPRDPDAWFVVYSFAFDGSRLSSPRAITAIQARTDGHMGGGLVVLPDGDVLMAIGDNGDSYEDGRQLSQDPTVHLAKLVRIDPANGATGIVGLGVRCVQRLVVSGSGADARLSFTDPGGWVSEELNSVAVSELTEAQPVNFGWGRGVDRKAHEGTFHIDPVGNSVEKIQVPEAGIAEPVAEFGREGARAVAISGPVISTASFSRITALFGDLVSGNVFAVTSPLAVKRQSVYRVELMTPDGKVITVKELAGGERPDPRFFNFPDGSAGMLLERTGTFYKLTERKPAS
jgi:hypothetical protein